MLKRRRDGEEKLGSPEPPAQTAYEAGKKTRLEEKAEFQELNKRLELIMIWNYEKDRSQGGLQEKLLIQRQKFEAEIKSLADQLAEERKTSGSLIQKLREEYSTLSGEHLNLNISFDEVQRQFAALKGRSESFELRSEALSKEVESLKSQNFKLEEDAKSAVHELDIERRERERLSIQLAKEKKRADEAASCLLESRADADSLREELGLERARSQEIIGEYQSQLAELARNRASIEEDLRQEFGKQLKDILSERQELYEQEKENAIAALREYYEGKLVEIKEALDSAEQASQTAQHKLKKLQGTLASVTRDRDHARAHGKALESVVEKLKEDLDALEKKHNDEMEDKERLIARFKDILREKDEKFNDLMSIKIALAMEIKAYRLLLETEEERLGLSEAAEAEAESESSPRGGLSVSAGRPAVSAADATASFLISSCDLEGNYVEIRNGSTEALSLHGWSLRSKNNRKEFKFPHRQLQPGQVLRLSISKKAKSRPGFEDLIWAEDNIWDLNGDSALLIGSDGKERNKVDITPM